MSDEQIGTKSEDITKYLDGIDGEMDEYKTRYVSKEWDDIPSFYLGRSHWGEERPSHKASPVLNFLRQAIERKTSMMTDTKPFVDVLPFYDPLQDVADALVEIMRAKWSEYSLDMTITDIIFYSELFGTCGVNTIYDKTLDWGKGDSTVHCVDPRNLNFDPNITAPQYLDQAQYLRMEGIYTTRELMNRYNNKDIKPDAPHSFLKEAKMTEKRGRMVRQVQKLLTRKSALERSLVREYWLKDHTMVSGKQKYPKGRHIIIAGGELVVDDHNPYWDGMHPVDILTWHRDPDTAWGVGEISDLKELQRLLNKLVTIIVENGMLMTNAIWIGDANALEPEDWENLDNVPGLKVKIKPGSNLKRETGQPLPSSIFDIIKYVESAIEKLSGNTEVVSGGVPGQVRSGSAIEALQTAAMATIRLKSRLVESLLERVGQKLISRIFQFQDTDRLMWRLKNDNDYESFKFAADVLRGKIPEAKKYMKNPKDAWKNFLFKVRPGSSLAMNNWQKSMMALQLYQAQPRPLIDRESVLETLDWPNRTEILRRLEEQEANQMEMAMQMQEAGGQGGGVPGEVKHAGSMPSIANIKGTHFDQGVREGISKNTGIQ